MKHPASAYVLAAGLLVLAAGGCDLFSTRSAENPSANRGTWEVPREPEQVLVNMSYALLERNAVNYMRSFDPEGFDFVADQVVLAEDPTMEDWSYVEENSHVTGLFSEGTLPRDSSVSVVFRSTDETLLGDSAVIITVYDLMARVALAGAPGPMSGTAHFYLRIGSDGYWQVYRWEDRRTEELATWSDLKSLVR